MFSQKFTSTTSLFVVLRQLIPRSYLLLSKVYPLLLIFICYSQKNQHPPSHLFVMFPKIYLLLIFICCSQKKKLPPPSHLFCCSQKFTSSSSFPVFINALKNLAVYVQFSKVYFLFIFMFCSQKCNSSKTTLCCYQNFPSSRLYVLLSKFSFFSSLCVPLNDLLPPPLYVLFARCCSILNVCQVMLETVRRSECTLFSLGNGWWLHCIVSKTWQSMLESLQICKDCLYFCGTRDAHRVLFESKDRKTQRALGRERRNEQGYPK